MKIYIMLTLIIAALLLAGCNSQPQPAPETTAPPTALQPTTTEPTTETAAEPTQGQPTVDTGIPPAEIANDEGGPEIITGEWNYTSSLVATHYQEPVVALVNISPYVQGNWTEWVPMDQQVLGRLTSPMAPAPVTYEVSVPRRAVGDSADLDNDGEEDVGVQIYALWVASNITGDSYLHQLDQTAYRSYLLDPNTGAFRQGAFLVYAPDDAQGFPSSAGDDGIFFTADDPVVALPAGYTLVTLSGNGEVSFDRSSVVRMDTLEEASIASPDLSGQGILESYNSLIDLLKVRYSYTDLRGLDWEEIRQTYLPQVQAADAAGDMKAYYLALNDLAISIRDAHVFVTASDAAMKSAPAERFKTEYGASLGAGGVELSNGRYIINFVDPQGPAAQAGWQIGTEIVSVDGVPMQEWIESLPLTSSSGNPEVIHLIKAALALSFPAGAETTIEYRQPGESELRSASLTAAEDLQTYSVDDEIHPLIDYKQLEDGYGYIRWSMFREPLYTLAIWENLLGEFHTAPGIVIDLRGNVGGNAELMHTMASYFFSEEDPASYHWLDYYTYDEKANDLVKGFTEDFPLYSPKPELAYAGAVAVLVDESTASAGEYFPQFLQRRDRAIVVGEHGTEGAGGSVETAALPGGIAFHFTKGRSYFAGTDELNLEAKGVTLDVRVPVSVENEQAKLDGQDPVLEAAVEALGSEAVRIAAENIVGKTYRLFQVVAAPGGPPAPAIPENYTITFDENGSLSVQTDCNQVSAEYVFGGGGAITITPATTTLAACPDGSIAEDFVQWLGAANSYQVASEGLALLTDPAVGIMGMLFVPLQ